MTKLNVWGHSFVDLCLWVQRCQQPACPPVEMGLRGMFALALRIAPMASASVAFVQTPAVVAPLGNAVPKRQ